VEDPRRPKLADAAKAKSLDELICCGQSASTERACATEFYQPRRNPDKPPLAYIKTTTGSTVVCNLGDVCLVHDPENSNTASLWLKGVFVGAVTYGTYRELCAALEEIHGHSCLRIGSEIDRCILP
jgi:hypothetical protein